MSGDFRRNRELSQPFVIPPVSTRAGVDHRIEYPAGPAEYRRIFARVRERMRMLNADMRDRRQATGDRRQATGDRRQARTPARLPANAGARAIGRAVNAGDALTDAPPLPNIRGRVAQTIREAISRFETADAHEPSGARRRTCRRIAARRQ
ncbi:hypothetical protein WJ28_13415 [Burkholderia thailandensis]|nr:hypothetical protein WJ27_03670 [Burkholderia thailandensis]KVG15947.1 hypothetical protein WJ28_13415 [Burkholderia thailandensis]